MVSAIGTASAMIRTMSLPVSSVPSRRRHRNRAVLLVALFAFGIAQALALAHAARHATGDPTGLPGNGHVQLCTDCASMLPLLTVAGTVAAAFALLRPAKNLPLDAAATRPALAAVHRAFRPRAPPTLPR